jgi:UDP-N-acetylglucosamine 3-dehydrogenase
MINDERVDVILCGVGRMGRNHLRVIQESSRFRLRAIVDPILAAKATEVSGTPVRASVDDVPDGDYRAAVVATPTETHHGVAIRLLQKGKDLLIEKPLASNTAQCAEIARLATERGRKVAVGHVERFNPVVRKLREILKSGWAGTAIHYTFTRVGGYPESVKDGNNVLIDLAVHDIDILQMLAGEVSLLSSVIHNTIQPSVSDTAEMLLRSTGGASASIHVNWITPTKIRTVRITGSKGVVFADLILQTCTIYGGNLLRRGPEPQLDFQQLAEDYRNPDKIDFGVRKEEPLRGQLDAFHRFLFGEETEICGLAEATRSVELAQEAVAVAKGGRT